MKKTLLNICASVALLFAASVASAQGVKIYKVNGTSIDIPASELDRIEAYDAPAAADNFFDGTWTMKQLVTDKEAMETTWNGMATYDNGFPAFNAADELTFNNGTLTPSLQSDFKNFFVGEATYEVMPEKYTLVVGVGDRVELTVLKLTGVNRYFSATDKSESNVAYIGLREIEDEDADEAGVMLLDVYLIDYESHSFAPEFLESGMYMSMDGSPYVATFTGMFINFLMNKK